MNKAEFIRVSVRRGWVPDEQPTADRPSLGKMYQVAKGLASWTDAEQEWIKAHPKWLGYMCRMQKTIEEVDAQADHAPHQMNVAVGL